MNIHDNVQLVLFIFPEIHVKLWFLTGVFTLTSVSDKSSFENCNLKLQYLYKQFIMTQGEA